ncbi:hypothetical protein DJ568_13280 [Mucilaginibacter hurinus]|uniref:PspC domain-containing protein n=1 Tax=Mucilaginibacter hurinus TaxID=2201324 RepID=A0A367GNJ7_9SPHI|nr:PspC domain-containing protein [Mucilaginibacter hurinus]RCH54263.1 hypothetical protein DJ568_13280 [Mucilaginibacter hurinus]
MEKKLYRDEQRKKIGGVCAGLADYFGVDVSIVRVIFLVTAFLHGTGGLVYVVLWVVLPAKNLFYGNPGVDYRMPEQDAYNPFRETSQPNFTMPNYNDANETFTGVPPKKTTNAGVIAGVILILLGAAFLLKNFGLLPHIDFHVVWPLVLVAIGISFILSGAKKQPWERNDWYKADNTADTVEKKDETNTNPNHPIE